MADKDQATDTDKVEEASFSEAFSERAANPFGKSEEGEEAGADASATTDQSADKADKVEAPAGEAAATDTSGGQKFDPWHNLSPEQRSHFEKLQASERSNRGRVGALTKKLSTLTSPTQQPPAKQEGEVRGEDDGAADIEARLDKVAEEYGDVNGPVVEVVKELRKEIASLKASATRDEVDADAEAMVEAYQELESKHPDFADFTAQNEAFVDWVGQQPKNIQGMVNSFDPKEVSLALTLYKTEQGLVTQDAGGDQPGDGDSGTATGDKRRRQLEGSRQVSTRGAPAAAGVPKDFGAAFKARSRQIEKEAGRAT